MFKFIILDHSFPLSDSHFLICKITTILYTTLQELVAIIHTVFFKKYFAMYLVIQLCPTPCDPMDCSLPGFSVHGDSPGKNSGVGCQAFLQEIFPAQGLTQVSHIACIFFTIWATREAHFTVDFPIKISKLNFLKI